MRRSRFIRVVLVVFGALIAIAAAPGRPRAQSDALFSFHSNPWLNLHHILWSRGDGAPLPAAMSDADRAAWTAGIESYASYSKRNLIFDEELVAMKEALRTTEGRTSLEGLPIAGGARETLERLMPIYRRHWWADHDRTNREWIAAVRPLVDRHGAAINQAMVRAYEIAKPDNPVWVDVSVRAHPNGAYETGPMTHVMISSVDQRYRGYAALEMLFHERSHAWDAGLDRPVAAAAKELGVTVPRQLWHAVLFYTAGELTARELKAHGIDYKHFAEPAIYTAMCGADCQSRISVHWTPHLDGRKTIAESLSALVAAFR
jgi:hypothetical protein